MGFCMFIAFLSFGSPIFVTRFCSWGTLETSPHSSNSLVTLPSSFVIMSGVRNTSIDYRNRGRTVSKSLWSCASPLALGWNSSSRLSLRGGGRQALEIKLKTQG
jgi:hypothetical protein